MRRGIAGARRRRRSSAAARVAPRRERRRRDVDVDARAATRRISSPPRRRSRRCAWFCGRSLDRSGRARKRALSVSTNPRERPMNPTDQRERSRVKMWIKPTKSKPGNRRGEGAKRTRIPRTEIIKSARRTAGIGGSGVNSRARVARASTSGSRPRERGRVSRPHARASPAFPRARDPPRARDAATSAPEPERAFSCFPTRGRSNAPLPRDDRRRDRAGRVARVRALARARGFFATRRRGASARVSRARSRAPRRRRRSRVVPPR